MTEKRKIYRKYNPNNSKNDWKNHPLVIATGAAVAAFLLATAIFTQLVLPTQTAKLDIELIKIKDELKDINDKNKRLEEQNTFYNSENPKLTQSIKKLKIELSEARAGAMFSPSTPYPMGDGLIQIGMSVDDIIKEYPSKKLRYSDNNRIVTVPIENSPFDSISYFLENNKNHLIDHISYDINFDNKKYSDNFIKNKLIESFGPPIETASKSLAKWNINKKYTLYTTNMRGFLIMKYGDEPIFWSMR